MTEYRRAEGVGPLTICLSCAIEGGLGWRVEGESGLSTTRTLTLFGFVAILAFSCSSRASNIAVVCIKILLNIWIGRYRDGNQTNLVRVLILGFHFFCLLQLVPIDCF